MLDPLHVPDSRVHSIGATNFTGGLAATRHLLSLGHHRIAYLGGPAAAVCNQARTHGYRAAMEADGMRVPDGYVRSGDFTYETGLLGATALLSLQEPPTAVFAGNDEIAAGVIETARTRGLRIPEDLSVVGFDDTSPARMTTPPLTTVRQPLREMGAPRCVPPCAWPTAKRSSPTTSSSPPNSWYARLRRRPARGLRYLASRDEGAPGGVGEPVGPGRRPHRTPVPWEH